MKRDFDIAYNADFVRVLGYRKGNVKEKGTQVQVKSTLGTTKWVSETLLPQQLVNHAKRKADGFREPDSEEEEMGEWDVSKVLKVFRFRHAENVKFSMYLVRWRDDSMPDEWIPKAQLDFTPKIGVPEWKPGDAGPAPPHACRQFEEGQQDVEVFKAYFLPDFQKQLRVGWMNRKSLRPVILRGCGTFCPPAAFEMLFGSKEGAPSVKRTSRLTHITYRRAQDVPSIIVGESDEDTVIQDPTFGFVESAWWCKEVITDMKVSHNDSWCNVRRLYVILSPVVFHYSPRHHRLAVSFDYSVADRSEAATIWTTRSGKQVPFTFWGQPEEKVQ